MAHTPTNFQRYPDSDSSDIYSPPEPGPSLSKDAITFGTPLKRKNDTNTQEEIRDKRQKTQTPIDRPVHPSLPLIANLPGEIWQHIFSFLPPRSLPPLLWTCRMFHRYLTDPDLEHSACTTPRGLRTVHPDQVWRTSRIRWLPSIPNSPPGIGEPELYRLLGRKDCQFCGKAASSPLARPSIWKPGPAHEGVRHVWPFTIRSCGSCLAQRTQDYRSLMLSDFSELSSVVPFLFLTQDEHVFSPSAFRSADEIPQDIEVRRVSSVSQLENVKGQFRSARDKSSSQAMSLLTAMAAERPAFMAICEAWEVWATDENVRQFLSAQCISLRNTPAPTMRTEEDETCSTFSDDSNRRKGGNTHSRNKSALQRPPTRTKAAAEEARIRRRADIERRCAQITPPIEAKLLDHMDSFKAAMQISMPITEDGWNMLKPKLLSQRDAAQQRETDRLAAARALEPSSDNANDSADSERIKERWETFQRPIRKDLEAYIDELIHNAWADGRAINLHTAPRFAADALVFARNRYAADKPQNMEPGNAFRLVLHNMKWIYEHKVKPLTETAHGVRDLFRCAGCVNEPKMYQFDSLIQHYAAKHTTNYSSRNVGVAWYEAVWPEIPPFQTDGASLDSLVKQHNPIYSSAEPGSEEYPLQAYSEPWTLYQPVAASHRPPPLTSPGFPPDTYGRYGAYSTPVPQHASHATSPTFSVGPGYPPPAHPGASSPFEGLDPRLSSYPTQTPFHAPPSSSTWAASPGYQPPSYAPSPAQNEPSFLQKQMDAVANITREIWDTLFAVKQIPPSVRIYVLIQHAIMRFKERFSNEPNIDLVYRCVNEHALLQPMKDANGLACKVCVLENESREEGHSHAFSLSSGERKLYSFALLLWHFKQVHIETKLALDNAQTHDDPEDLKRYDWKEDMIELPEDTLIAGLRSKPGMLEPRRVAIFKEAFPNLFADVTPEPSSQYGHHMSGSYAAPYQHQWPASGSMSPPAARSQIDMNASLASQGFIKIEPGDPYATPYGCNTFRPSQFDQYDPSIPSVPVANRQAGNNYRGRGYRERGFRGRRGGPRHPSGSRPNHPGRQSSSEGIPSDLLQSLTTPHRHAPYGGQLHAHHAPPPPPAQYPRYDYFPPPPPPHMAHYASQHSGQYGHSPPASAGREAEEDVEYVYVRRKDPSSYSY